MTDSASLARRLMRAHDTAVLATSLPDDGHPYASLVLVAVDYDVAPILLLSDLAEHSKNIATDGRISLLFDGTRGLNSPMAGARLSVQGLAARNDDPRLRQRFLARHADAAGYADFSDFSFYRVDVERGHLIAGFGQIEWIDGSDLLFRLPDVFNMAGWEGSVISHMNQDHGDAIQDMAQGLLGAEGRGWIMTGCDGEGGDLRRGGEVLRLEFAHPAMDGDSVRRELIVLAQSAREFAS